MIRHMLAVLSLAISAAAPAAPMHHEHHAPASAATPDNRIAVAYPPALRAHTLANMRDHLLALTEILDRLGARDYSRAGEIAEQRLGMSSLQSHGAHEAAPHMPSGMQAAGGAMHRAASRFAQAAEDAAVDDRGQALPALADVVRACVACHSAYRLE